MFDAVKYAHAFNLLAKLASAVTEVHKDSVPAPGVTFSKLSHNGKFYCAVIVWKGGKKKVLAKYEDAMPEMAVQGCAMEFLKSKVSVTELAKLQVAFLEL